jgi:hypothetical protein
MQYLHNGICYNTILSTAQKLIFRMFFFNSIFFFENVVSRNLQSRSASAVSTNSRFNVRNLVGSSQYAYFRKVL